MTARSIEIYKRLSQMLFPIVCVIALYLAHTRAECRDTLYWETPSIPFQPFCDEGGNWGAFRPIRGVKMSEKFVREVIHAMGTYGGTMHLSYSEWRGSILGANPHPLLVTPKLFNDVATMLTITRDEVNAMNGTTWVPIEENGKTIWEVSPNVYCKDVEGKVKEF